MNTLWKYMPAGVAHELAPIGLSFYADIFGTTSAGQELYQWKSFSWKGMQFPNRMGIAGGVDKNATLTHVWSRIGAGFIEIGTVTPKPQEANPGKIIDRDWEKLALWNKMGFPSHGAKEVFYNLKNSVHDIPTFVNIGKNRLTKNEDAISDYVDCVQILDSVADAFVINVSSPNTKGLRDLQNKNSMTTLFQTLTSHTSKPLLVKLSPDMTDEQLQDVVQGCVDGGCSGFVLTNTTLSRTSDLHFPNEGGVSGKPVAELSKHALKKVTSLLGNKRKDFLLVSVGGVLSVDDIFSRLNLGADLVQTYAGLVFNGPRFFHQVAQSAKELQ